MKLKLGLLASSFDPFPHPGIISAMRQAMSPGTCDAVVAALHIDPSVDRPKKRTPATNVTERTMMLEAIRYVADVVPYRTEDDLRRIIADRRPDFLILGEEYRDVAHTGHESGIPVFYAHRCPEWSGTEFTRRIADSVNKAPQSTEYFDNLVRGWPSSLSPPWLDTDDQQTKRDKLRKWLAHPAIL